VAGVLPSRTWPRLPRKTCETTRLDVLPQVSEGAHATVTVNGVAVAEVSSVRPA